MSTQITGNSVTSVLKKFAKKLSGKEIEGNSTTEVLEDFANKYDGGGGGGGDPVPVNFTITAIDMITGHAPDEEYFPPLTGRGFLNQPVTIDLSGINSRNGVYNQHKSGDRFFTVFGLANGTAGDVIQVMITEDNQEIKLLGYDTVIS